METNPVDLGPWAAPESPLPDPSDPGPIRAIYLRVMRFLAKPRIAGLEGILLMLLGAEWMMQVPDSRTLANFCTGWLMFAALCYFIRRAATQPGDKPRRSVVDKAGRFVLWMIGCTMLGQGMGHLLFAAWIPLFGNTPDPSIQAAPQHFLPSHPLAPEISQRLEANLEEFRRLRLASAGRLDELEQLHAQRIDAVLRARAASRADVDAIALGFKQMAEVYSELAIKTESLDFAGCPASIREPIQELIAEFREFENICLERVRSVQTAGSDLSGTGESVITRLSQAEAPINAASRLAAQERHVGFAMTSLGHALTSYGFVKDAETVEEGKR